VTVHLKHKVKRANQQDATNSMFIIKVLPQHVSVIIMPIIRRIRPCPTACGVLPGCVGCGWLWSCGDALWAVCTLVHTAHNAAQQDHSQPQPTHPGRTPHAVGHGLILLMMGIMMIETCWGRTLIINIELVASCWFSLSSLNFVTENALSVLWVTNLVFTCTIGLYRFAMVQSAVWRPVITEARIRSRLSPYEFHGGKSGTRRGFSVPLVSNFPWVLHTHLHLQTRWTEEQTGEDLILSNKIDAVSLTVEHQ